MSENKVNNVNKASVSESEAFKDYKENFIPSVHRIGRATMAIAFILAFLPVLYFYFVKGYKEPISAYVSVTVAISSIGIGMWLTEPLSYWPVLGSAGTYMGYLSGNVGALRFPVALNLQSTMNANINTPRGQVVTIVGIASSVVVNLVILLASVLVGEWLVGILPAVVIESFGFVMVGLLGSMILMRLNGKDGIVKGTMDALPYLATAVVIKFVSSKVSFLLTWGMAISVGCCILVAYAIYKNDCKKDAAK